MGVRERNMNGIVGGICLRINALADSIYRSFVRLLSGGYAASDYTSADVIDGGDSATENTSIFDNGRV